jgi:predicted ATPase
MIKSVRLINFFSFGDCTIDLESDLNVLVGINGSGKSNFLRAFQLLKAGMDGKLQEQIAKWGGMGSINNKGKNNLDVSVSFTIANEIESWPDGYEGDVIYRFYLLHNMVDEEIIRPDGKFYLHSLGGNVIIAEDAVDKVNFLPRKRMSDGKELIISNLSFDFNYLLFHDMARSLRRLDLYKEFNTVENAPMRTTVRATGVDKLLPNGDNMFQVLNTTGLKSAKSYDAIESGLQDVNQYFQRFRMNVYGQGSVEFYLQEKGLETPIHAAQVSDGTLCYLCLLVALYQYDRGNTILFDEPERNLHPDMLFELAKQLEKASEKSQIILTTHAPGLLNQFPLRAVRVFEKDENNQTIVKKFTEEDFAGWYDEFAPGQMWRNGDLGGNRY